MSRFRDKVADSIDKRPQTRDDWRDDALKSIACSLEELTDLLREGITIKIERVVKVEEQPVWPETKP